MPVGKDQFWEYVEEIDETRWKCMFCDQEFTGKAPRIKAHLGKVPRMGIRPCKSNTLDQDVSSAAKAALRQKDIIDKDEEGPTQSVSKRQRLESNTQPLSIGSSNERQSQGPNQPADHVRVEDIAAAIYALQRVIAGQSSRSQQTIRLTDHIRVEDLAAAMPALQRVIAAPGSSSQQEIPHHSRDLFKELPEHEQSDAVKSMVYEANCRVRDPVHGCAGAMSCLQQMIDQLNVELALAHAEVVHLQLRQCSSDLNLATHSAETASPSPRRITPSQSRPPISTDEADTRLEW